MLLFGGDDYFRFGSELVETVGGDCGPGLIVDEGGTGFRLAPVIQAALHNQ